MVKMFQLSLTGAAKRVSDVYGGPAGADPNPQLDISYRALYFQAETGALAVGDASTVTASIYGNLIAAAATLSLEPAQPGSPMHLSDFWASGTGTLHVLGIPL